MKFNQLLNQMEVNKEELLQRLGGNRELAERFILKYRKNNTFKELEAAEARGDMQQLAMEVHTLKGVASNLSMTLLTDRCSRYMSHWRAEEMELLNEDLKRIKEVHCRMMDCLDEYAREA